MFVGLTLNQRLWIKKCKFCNSTITRKYGIRNEKQRYKCLACNRYFTGGNDINSEHIWLEYTQGKQTYKQLATKYNCSARTIQRRIDLHKVSIPKKEPREVVVLMDTTLLGEKFWSDAF